MKTKAYALLCAGLSAVVIATMLFVPAASDTLEGLVLLFLSTNAS